MSTKILVTGTLVARPDTFEQILALSREHVARSRTEPGCISHHVLRDPESDLRLVFLEEWESKEALVAHFQAPGPRDFVAAVSELTSEPPAIRIFDASPISI